MNGEANLTFDGTKLNLTTGGAGFRITRNSQYIELDGNFGNGGDQSLATSAGFRIQTGGVGNSYERLRITSSGNLGVAGSTGTDFSLLDGMVINTASGSAGLMLNSSSSSHYAYLSFSYGSGSSTSHADQFSAYIGRVGDNTLILGTNNTIRAQVDSSGNFNIGANASSNPFNYLRFGASQYGAADIRPKNESNHKVGLEFYTDGTQDTTINPTVKMTIDSAGTVTKPLHPVFATKISYVNSYYSTNTKITMQAAHIDTRSGFSNSNDRYVAPADGKYLFYFFSNIDYNGDGTIACIFKKNGQNFTSSEGGHMYSYAQNSGWHALGGQIITSMSTNDYIEVWTTANNMKVDGNSYGQFGGYMIG